MFFILIFFWGGGGGAGNRQVEGIDGGIGEHCAGCACNGIPPWREGGRLLGLAAHVCLSLVFGSGNSISSRSSRSSRSSSRRSGSSRSSRRDSRITGPSRNVQRKSSLGGGRGRGRGFPRADHAEASVSVDCIGDDFNRCPISWLIFLLIFQLTHLSVYLPVYSPVYFPHFPEKHVLSELPCHVMPNAAQTGERQDANFLGSNNLSQTFQP